MRIRISKKRQHNGQKKKYKRTNNDLQNITHKTKDRVTKTALKTWGKLMCSGRASSSCCSTSDIHIVDIQFSWRSTTNALSYYNSLRSEFRLVMSVTIFVKKRLFVGRLTSYLRYVSLFAHSDVQYILCCGVHYFMYPMLPVSLDCPFSDCPFGIL